MRNWIIYILLGTFFAFSIGPMPSYADSFALPKAMSFPTFAKATAGTPSALVGNPNTATLKGLTIHPDNPLQFDFIVEPNGSLPPVGLPAGRQGELKEQSLKLIKYFLASLTIPEEDTWVNLSPYEKNRIIPESFGQTLMGRDLLAQDYLLKQMTASLIHPDTQLGKEFWAKVYKQAQEKFGTTNIPINTFNKVWIMPDKATVWEHDNSAFVVERHLKVMLEEDYLAASHSVIPVQTGIHKKNDINTVSSQVVCDIVIPALEKEVNEGQTFAQLREIYNAMILATWFKKQMKQTLLGQAYVDKNKVSGVGLPTRGHHEMVSPSPLPSDLGLNTKAPQGENLTPDEIYQQYLNTFKKGVFNFIKEEPDPTTGQLIPRKYFSGGIRPPTQADVAIISVPLKSLSDMAMANLPSNAALKLTVNCVSPRVGEHDAPPATLSKDKATVAVTRIKKFDAFLSKVFKNDYEGKGMRLPMEALSDKSTSGPDLWYDIAPQTPPFLKDKILVLVAPNILYPATMRDNNYLFPQKIPNHAYAKQGLPAYMFLTELPIIQTRFPSLREAIATMPGHESAHTAMSYIRADSKRAMQQFKASHASAMTTTNNQHVYSQGQLLQLFQGAQELLELNSGQDGYQAFNEQLIDLMPKPTQTFYKKQLDQWVHGKSISLDHMKIMVGLAAVILDTLDHHPLLIDQAVMDGWQELIDAYNRQLPMNNMRFSVSYGRLDIPLLFILPLTYFAAGKANEDELKRLGLAQHKLPDGAFKDRIIAMDLMVMGIHMNRPASTDEGVDLEMALPNIRHALDRLNRPDQQGVATDALKAGLFKMSLSIYYFQQNNPDGIKRINEFLSDADKNYMWGLINELKDTDVKANYSLAYWEDGITDRFFVFPSDGSQLTATEALLDYWSAKTQRYITENSMSVFGWDIKEVLEGADPHRVQQAYETRISWVRRYFVSPSASAQSAAPAMISPLDGLVPKLIESRDREEIERFIEEIFSDERDRLLAISMMGFNLFDVSRWDLIKRMKSKGLTIAMMADILMYADNDEGNTFENFDPKLQNVVMEIIKKGLPLSRLQFNQLLRVSVFNETEQEIKKGVISALNALGQKGAVNYHHIKRGYLPLWRTIGFSPNSARVVKQGYIALDAPIEGSNSHFQLLTSEPKLQRFLSEHYLADDELDRQIVRGTETLPVAGVEYRIDKEAHQVQVINIQRWVSVDQTTPLAWKTQLSRLEEDALEAFIEAKKAEGLSVFVFPTGKSLLDQHPMMHRNIAWRLNKIFSLHNAILIKNARDEYFWKVGINGTAPAMLSRNITAVAVSEVGKAAALQALTGLEGFARQFHAKLKSSGSLVAVQRWEQAYMIKGADGLIEPPMLGALIDDSRRMLSMIEEVNQFVKENEESLNDPKYEIKMDDSNGQSDTLRPVTYDLMNSINKIAQAIRAQVDRLARLETQLVARAITGQTADADSILAIKEIFVQVINLREYQHMLIEIENPDQFDLTRQTGKESDWVSENTQMFLAGIQMINEKDQVGVVTEGLAKLKGRAHRIKTAIVEQDFLSTMDGDFADKKEMVEQLTTKVASVEQVINEQFANVALFPRFKDGQWRNTIVRNSRGPLYDFKDKLKKINVLELEDEAGWANLLDVSRGRLERYMKMLNDIEEFTGQDAGIGGEADGFPDDVYSQFLIPAFKFFHQTSKDLPARAMAVEDKAIAEQVRPARAVGGIDLNAQHLDLSIKRDAKGMPLPASQQNWAQVSLSGLEPSIIKMEPVNLKELLGATP